jgi:uncharacterized protein (AIM24 family)
MAGPREYACRWCGRTSDIGPDALTCPACGAGVDVRRVADDAGWVRLPPIRDMARIQFGNSRCQIEGTYVPVADFDLAAGDSVYFSHHVLLWQEPRTELSRLPLAGWWRRLWAGLPLVMAQTRGPGRVAFSRDAPGEIITVPLAAGASVDVREGSFIAASGQVRYEWLASGVWYRTAGGRHYPVGQYLDRFTAADGHGLLLLNGSGDVFVRDLGAGESLVVKPSALVYADPRGRWRCGSSTRRGSTTTGDGGTCG